MTPPHIEKAARAMCVVYGIDPDAASIDKMTGKTRRAWEARVNEAEVVWSLARAHTIEEAAKRAENWSDAQHMAHDMRTGVFPKQTKVHDAIASAIRALAVENIEADQYCQPSRNGEDQPRKFVVMFDDADRPPVPFEDEAEARTFYAKAKINWNCYLFGALAVGE